MREAEILAQGFSSGKRKVCEYCYSLYQFIASCEIQKKLKKQELFFKEKGEKALEKEYAQIYGIVMELLDRMVEILGEEEITRTEFVQLLETGFAKSKVALIPPSMDQVLVGDMERTRLKEIKALFFVGVNAVSYTHLQEGKPIEMNCHFCNTNYNFTVEELKEILRRCK